MMYIYIYIYKLVMLMRTPPLPGEQVHLSGADAAGQNIVY